MQGVKTSHPAGGVCMITGELTRYGLSMQSFTRLQVPAGSAASWVMGVLVAHNINSAFRQVMENPSLQWAWLMGDDHTFPPGLLLKLLDRDVDVVLPLCLNRSIPMDPTIVEMGGAQPRLKPLENLPDGGLYKLAPDETCGDAGLLVRRRVLEAIGDPWHVHRKSGGHNAEDREFIDRCKDAGFDVFVDLDNPIGHISPIVYEPVHTERGWEVRMSNGNQPIVQIGAKR